jgi:hypothetical protein
MNLLNNTVSLRNLLSAAEKKQDPNGAALEELARIVKWSVPVERVRDIPTFVPKVVPALPSR